MSPSTASALSIAVSQDPTRTIVRVSGEVDFATSPELETSLRDAADEGATIVIADLRWVSFIDASGLQMLLRVQAAVRRQGCRLAVVKNASLQRLLSVTDAAPLLTLLDWSLAA